jgi:hypothetical protein
MKFPASYSFTGKQNILGSFITFVSYLFQFTPVTNHAQYQKTNARKYDQYF